MNKVQIKNGEYILLREAKKEDAKKIIEYIELRAGESDNLTFGPGEFKVSIEEEENILESAAKSNTTLYLIAELNGEIVGLLNFFNGKRPRTQHSGEFGISVAKQYWGIGIGRSLIEYLIQWAKASGIITKINLHVRTDNVLAIELYEKLGFVVEGRITRNMIIDGIYYDVFAMGLEI